MSSTPLASAAPGPAAPPSPDRVVRPLDLASLSLEQRLGQMLLARSPGSEAACDRLVELIRERRVGGVHLGASNPFRERILAAADYPLLVFENMEHGFPRADAVPLPVQAALGATGRTEDAYDCARLAARDARARGYTGVFGPIFDLALVPEASCVCGRSFGSDPALVARLGTAMVRGYQDEGLVVTAKHYPGFGASHVDSHLGMVTIEVDRALLLNRELVPYVTALREAGLSGVMSGHIMVPAIDPRRPASLSPALLGLLRELGFEGIIVTDSLAMMGMAAHFDLEETQRLALAAGNDLILPSYRVDNATALAWMRRDLETGAIDEERIAASAARVIAAQNQSLRLPGSGPLSADQRRRAEERVLEIVRDSVSAVLEPGHGPSVPTDIDWLVLLQEGNTFVPRNHPALRPWAPALQPATEISAEMTGNLGAPQEVSPRISRHGELLRECGTADAMATEILRRFPRAQVRIIPDHPSYKDIEQALVRAAAHPRVLAFLYARTREYTGSADVSERLCSLVEAIAPKTEAVVLCGNAWAARRLPRVRRLLIAHGTGMIPLDGALQLSERAALDVLCGVAPARGRLSIPLHPYAERPRG